MSQFSNDYIPAKGDVMINPNTQKPIKIGGPTWRKLVREGIVAPYYSDPKEIGDIPDGDVENAIDEANKKLPFGKQAVRGRGRFKGKLVVRNKVPSAKESVEYAAKIASKVVKKNMSQLEEDDDDEDLEKKMERIILEEMAIEKRGYEKKQAKAGRPARKPVGVKIGAPKMEKYKMKKLETETETEDSTTDIYSESSSEDDSD